MSGLHEVKAEEAYGATNPKVGMWNSRSKPPLDKLLLIKLINILSVTV